MTPLATNKVEPSIHPSTLTLEVHLGALDKPDQFAPTYECWTVRREAWLLPFPLEQCYERDRTDGRSATRKHCGHTSHEISCLKAVIRNWFGYVWDMLLNRRIMLVGSVTVISGCAARSVTMESSQMYGLIGKMRAKAGQRTALATILIEGVAGMPGCLSYVVANDPVDEALLWVTEAWVNKEAHGASLSLPSVQHAIARGRPLIDAMESVAETLPVGGHGLISAQ